MLWKSHSVNQYLTYTKRRLVFMKVYSNMNIFFVKFCSSLMTSSGLKSDLRFCRLCALLSSHNHRSDGQVVPRLFHAVFAMTLRFFVQVAMQAFSVRFYSLYATISAFVPCLHRRTHVSAISNNRRKDLPFWKQFSEFLPCSLKLKTIMPVYLIHFSNFLFSVSKRT